MKEMIVKKLQEIEKEQGIKILFAVENGSRAWGMESVNSDYDVRFVFTRLVGDYLKIDKPNEVIVSAYDKEGNKMCQEGCFIDIEGFDVFKFARMLWSSNPQVIEWLVSDIVYMGEPFLDTYEQNKVFKDFAINQFKPISLYFHYKSMCKNNYHKYLKSGNDVTYKKYLYSMRGLLNAKYVVIYKKVPPIKFLTLLEEMRVHIPIYIHAKLRLIVDLKKGAKEKDITQNIVDMDTYIENFLKNDDEAPQEKKLTLNKELSNELFRIVMEESGWI